MNADAIELWEEVGGLRCVLHPLPDHWLVLLLRDHQVIKSDVFIDGASAIAAADRWRALVDDDAKGD